MGLGDKIHTAKWRENHRAETLHRIYKTACVGGLVTAELPVPDLEPVEQAEWRLISGALNRITSKDTIAKTTEVHVPQQALAPSIEAIQPVIAVS